MNVIIIRHADAGDPKKWTGDDADRPLSPLGQQQARALGDALKRHGVVFQAAVSSPLARTWQTAEGVLEAWPPATGITFSDLLAPGELRRRKLAKYLAGLGSPSIAIVGHDPDL